MPLIVFDIPFSVTVLEMVIVIGIGKPVTVTVSFCDQDAPTATLSFK